MMTVHVLHAGDGYTYLTRQVASGDHTVRRGQDLTDYYTEEGNPPGQWMGAGSRVLGIDGEVSEAQMRALFGEGLHPEADAMQAKLIAAGTAPKDAIDATRLGRRFMISEVVDDGWKDAIATAYESFRTEHGRNPEVGVERDLIRYNVASDRVAAQLERPATDAEVSTFLAKMGKAPRQPVAGYDLVFTPVKSVSVLWALADKDTAAEIRRAHNAAWQETIGWLEKEAALTRVGAAGVGQVNTNGLTAAAFEHRDSRTGDPNLHTHVAVSTKVQGHDGKWRSLDGRVLHALGVSASERYNSLIEQELRQRLGVTFAPETRGRNKRAVREIVGVGKELRDSFSSRRAAIEDAYELLLKEYVDKHGHNPPRAVQLQMAQQATLDTREGKAPPKSLDEQRAEWRQSAVSLIGERQVDALASVVRQRPQLDQEETERIRALADMSVDELAAAVIERVETDRATWRRSHIEAEALRLARDVGGARFTVVAGAGRDDIDELTSAITEHAMGTVIRITAPDLNPVPDQLRRDDGESIYHVHATDAFTSERILQIEDRLLDAARTDAGTRVSMQTFAETLESINASSTHPLDASQAELARRFATSGRKIAVGIGPAGTGKTTAMRVFARAVEAAGARVLALAPTAVASTILADEIDVEAETAHKLVWIHKHGTPEQRASDQYRVDEHTILLIDEAGMASTPLLADVLDLADRTGASIRLLGDPAQLAAVESGGALRLLERNVGASYLDTMHRFVDKDEAAATLLMRVGRPAALDYYVENDRATGGLRQTMLEDIYAAWSTDRTEGAQSIMVAGTNDEVAALNARARLDLISTGAVDQAGPTLHDGNRAGIGDTIVTRQNNRRLRTNQGRDFVANGDLWTVIDTDDGALKVKSLRHGGVLTLPAEYVASDVELGYAATINRVQGMTVDTAHILVDPEATSREQLYVAATRGRESNKMYVVVDQVLETDGHSPDKLRNSILDGLTKTFAREGAELSAHETIERALDHAVTLAKLVPEYEDARVREFDPEMITRMEDTLRQMLPAEYVDQIVTDEAWSAFANRLADHEAAGADIGAAIARVASPNDLDELSPIESLAKVYHFRLGPPAQRDDAHELPPWITPPPAEDGDNVELRVWLNHQADLIVDRIAYLVDDVIDSAPAWAERLQLDDLTDQDRRHLATVVAYRDLHQVVDEQRALGTPPAHRTEEYDAAAAALARLRPAPQAEPAGTAAGLADRARALGARHGGRVAAPETAPTVFERLQHALEDADIEEGAPDRPVPGTPRREQGGPTQ